MNPKTLALIDYLRSGYAGPMPPIHVQPDGLGQYRILDGRHRVLAYKMIGKTEICAYAQKDTRTWRDKCHQFFTQRWM